jgi:hypothetical protein
MWPDASPYALQFETLDEQITEYERVIALTESAGLVPNAFTTTMLNFAKRNRDDGDMKPLSAAQMRGALYQLIVLEKLGINTKS